MKIHANKKLILSLSFVVFSMVTPAFAMDYYVSSIGSDTNDGLTQQTAWQTTSKINATDLNPGDNVYFEGGKTFSGGLYLDSNDMGTAAQPIKFGSYGTGRAVINSVKNVVGGSGFYAYNASGIEISNINFNGLGQTSQSGDGINFYNDTSSKLDYIKINNVETKNEGLTGITLGGNGFTNVTITNSNVYNNGAHGIMTWGNGLYQNENLYVAYIKAYNNSGIARAIPNTGNGIVLGSVKNAVIERSVAYSNGANCDPSSGPVGIWAYDADNVTIQYNESYSNKTAGGNDGDGFDLDQNTSNSVMQYNYSHDNDGAGYLLAQPADNSLFTNNVVRYNISQNDGRKLSNGSIAIWGRVNNSEIYNNSIFLKSSVYSDPAAIVIANWGIEDRSVNNINIRNNIFQTKNGKSVIRIYQPILDVNSTFTFQNNDYYSSGSTFYIEWGDTIYNSLTDFRNNTGQEMLNSLPTGYSVDPKFVSAGTAPTLNNSNLLNTITAYKLQGSSPLFNKGFDLNSMFRINMGGKDFWGTALFGGSAPEIGAYELIDTVAPSGSVVINSGATKTTSQTVKLTLSSTDNFFATSNIRMMISNDPTFAGAAWMTYATSKSWTLTSTKGTKTVYVKFIDANDNVSPVYTATIQY